MNTVSRFSCGAASAVATKLALTERPDTVVVYIDPGSEHPDNERFLADCQEWFGKEIIILKSDKYANPWEVWEARRYIRGVAGAPCTGELKRKVGDDWMYTYFDGLPWEVFGYTVEEIHRVERFRSNNPERSIWPILVERGLTKGDCLGVLAKAGIEIPAMYKLGYRNNNCIGCPKGGMGYWNKIRVDFPEVFDRMAKLEREVGASVNRKERREGGKRISVQVFLDELPVDAGNYSAEPSISCSLMCETAMIDMEAP